MQLDLFATCGACANLGAAIESGVRYCHGMLMWRWAHEIVLGCRSRR
jgi:hypothetical protein